MATQQILPQLPKTVKFRVLIIGRANAGKTSILQRVCDTTESPVISRKDQSSTHEEVLTFLILVALLISSSSRFDLTPQWRLDGLLFLCLSVMAGRDDLMQRGEHDIEDELTFANHTGYVFHDSRGFEAGEEMEVKIVQDFVRRRSQESRLNERLHAIWFAPFGISGREFTTVCSLGIASRWTMLGQG
jgi:hypothetical protein